MKVLITGGAGFIGSHLADALVERGNEVWVIDDLSTGRRENIAHLEKNANFHFVLGTIMDSFLLEELIAQCDYIYHLAAAVGVRYVMENPLHALRVNIEGTEKILSLANKKKKKVLIASSSEVYGKNEKTPFKEDADCVLGATERIRWGYACSKKIDEFIALAYFKEKKLPVIIARFFNTCGPRQVGEYGMVIPRFIKQALLNHPLTVFGDGEQRRCFSYVGDVVDAIIKLMATEKAIGEVVNIGNDEEISIKQLAVKVKELTGSSSPIEYIPYEKAYNFGFEDLRKRVPDLTKIKKLIQYQPRVSLEELLKKTIEYFKR
jgi:UDP-glucose 4-epimerase